MVCIPCVLIPFVMWVFHKFIYPWIKQYWDPFAKEKKVEPTDTDVKDKAGGEGLTTKEMANGSPAHVANGNVMAGGDKKTD